MATSTQQLIEIKLDGTTLVQYARTRRKAGASWEKIAHDLATDTGILVTSASIRNWMAGEKGMERKTAASAKS